MPKQGGKYTGPIVAAPTRVIDVPLPYRLPDHIKCNTFLPTANHNRWMRILEDAQKIVMEDVNVQKRAAKGVRIPSRKLPLDMLGRTYAQYCNLINKIYESYVNVMQLQRNEYMLEIVAIILKRMYELRNEIVHYVVNDYIFVDDALIQMHMTPYDIEIVVPYHLPLEARPASKEQLLQTMWLSATRRKGKAGKPKKQKKPPSKPMILDDYDDGPLDGVQPDTKTADEQDEVEEEESESEDGTKTICYQTTMDHLLARDQMDEFRLGQMETDS